MTATECESEISLAEDIFGNAQLGDRRRTVRLVSTFEMVRKYPGGTLPDKVSSPADLRAFYRLCDCEEVTHAALITAARQYTLRQIAEHAGPVLAVHDATELDYTSLTSLADDLGQIGKGTRRGYVCQNVLAVAADSGETLGLLDQIPHHRDDVPKGESITQRRERATRESLNLRMQPHRISVHPRLERWVAAMRMTEPGQLQFDSTRRNHGVGRSSGNVVQPGNLSRKLRHHESRNGTHGPTGWSRRPRLNRTFICVSCRSI